jgi:PAT family beta-lactamase induction signal transducer AmpG
VTWQQTYFLMAGIMACGIVLTLFMPEPTQNAPLPSSRNLPDWLQSAVIAPLKDFTRHQHWIAILVFVVLFKLADAFLGIMFNPFLLELGFSKTEIARIVKLYGLAATLLGSFAGGALVARFGLYPVLMGSSFLHLLTNLLLVKQASLGANSDFLTLCIVSENFTAGMGTTAFIAYLSGLCRREYTATHYALLSSLASIARTVIASASGITAIWLGWQGFFAFSSLLALPAMLMLWWLHQQEKSE